MGKKTFTCIVCPRGCRVTIDDNMNVTGNKCLRGEKYARTEMTNPTRILTTTVKTTFKNMPRVSVKTEEPIPKELIMQAMEEINKVTIKEQKKIGDIVIENILDTGINVILTKPLIRNEVKNEEVHLSN